MEITNYTTFRSRLKSFLDTVILNRTPLFVTRSRGEDIVVLSRSDYESMQETLHLLSSSANAKRLFESIEEFNNGKGIEKDLLED